MYRRNATAIIRRHRTKRTVYSDLDKVVRVYLGKYEAAKALWYCPLVAVS